MDDLDRLFHRLIQNVRGKNPAHLQLPFTVAELYDQLVPYRHNRRELGIETNQDYEIAVMRLLAGERGYLLGDSAMQDQLRQETERRDPDTGAFREFSTAEISINPDALAKISSGAHTVAHPPQPEEKPPQADAAAPAPAAPTHTTTARPAAATPAASFDDFAVAEGCRFCGATIPEGRDVRFCPSCGQNLTVARCPACGGEVESSWRYCITCGRPTGA